MASDAGVKPPVWFWIVGGILLLWGLMGCFSLYLHVTVGPKMDPNPTQWDLDYYASLPAWFNACYVVAVGGGVLGAAALLARSRFATLLTIASLLGIIVQFGWVFLATDIIAHKGVWVVYFPLFILVMALFQLWVANTAARRGWIS